MKYKKLILLKSKTFLFALSLFLFFLNTNIGPAKSRNLKSHVKSCISLATIKKASKNSVDWYVVANNVCKYPITMGRNLKITKAINLDVQVGTILLTKDLILLSQDKKIVFVTFQENLSKKASLSWKLIHP